MRLLLVELRRGWTRRSTKVLVALAVLMIAVLGVGMFLASSADLDSSATEGLRQRQAQIDDCVANGGWGNGGELRGDDLTSLCEEMIGPEQWFVQDPRFHLTDLWPGAQAMGGDGVLVVTAFFLALGALMAGATFVGGDWRYGTVGTLLTWEPRRTRVFAAKAAAVAAWSLLLGVVLQVLVAVSVLPAAWWRGTTEGADAEWLGELAVAILRISALGAGAALVGFAIASLGRNTAAALGVAFGYVAVAESVLRALRPGWQPWLLSDNATVVIFGRQPPGAAFDRSVGAAAVILGCYLVAALVLSGVSFARRDVA